MIPPEIASTPDRSVQRRSRRRLVIPLTILSLGLAVAPARAGNYLQDWGSSDQADAADAGTASEQTVLKTPRVKEETSISVGVRPKGPRVKEETSIDVGVRPKGPRVKEETSIDVGVRPKTQEFETKLGLACEYGFVTVGDEKWALHMYGEVPNPDGKIAYAKDVHVVVAAKPLTKIEKQLAELGQEIPPQPVAAVLADPAKMQAHGWRPGIDGVAKKVTYFHKKPNQVQPEIALERALDSEHGPVKQTMFNMGGCELKNLPTVLFNYEYAPKVIFTYGKPPAQDPNLSSLQ